MSITLRDVIQATLDRRIADTVFSDALAYFAKGDIRRYGGSEFPSLFVNYAAFQINNRTALQAAIADFAANGGVVTIPWTCDYGYVITTRSTWPSFSGVTSDILVLDYAKGASYALPAKDGEQERRWYHTAQTVPTGQHDGNGHISRSDWHPYYALSNDMDLSGARDAFDNRRASIVIYVNGNIYWRLGQGTLSSAAANDDQLANFTLEMWNSSYMTGDAQSIFIVDRQTGNMNFNIDSNGFAAAYNFQPRLVGSIEGMFSSLGQDCRLVLRTVDGAPEDVYLRNNDGAFTVTNASGDALTVTKTTGDVLIGTTTDAPSAKLNVVSTTQGVLFPRMTTAQRDAIGAPAEGLVVYNTTTHKLNLRTAAAWEQVTSV